MADNLAAELNGFDDEDEALRLAIAMSLGQDPSAVVAGDPGKARRKGGSIIDLTEEADQGDETASPTPSPSPSPSIRSPDVVSPAAPVPTSNSTAPRAATSGGLSSLLGLDRKQMEADRLARLRSLKRPAEDDQHGDAAASSHSGQPAERDESAGGESDKHAHRPSQRLKMTAAGPGNASPKILRSSHGTSSTPGAAPLSTLQYPRGVVKRTWALGQPRRGDDITIEEVLQKSELDLAVLNSFQWDENWLLSKVDLDRTKLILVAYAADEAQKAEMRANVAGKNIRFCFPPGMEGGMGCMHSKLQLLKYKDSLRIVVPSANLMPYDWGETGVMENMVFLIDLPKIEDTDPLASSQLTAFGEDLCYFLSAQGLDERLVQSLARYDFSETARYGFVHSIAGSHQAESWKRTGYCGLGRAVHALGLKSDNPIELDYVCASLGSVNYGLLKALYYACQGDSGLIEYGARSKRRANSTTGGTDDETIQAHVRVYFPSRGTVMQSLRGRNSAGTICFQPRWWSSPTFPRDVLRDCKSTRRGLLMHSKIIFVRRQTQDSVGGSGCDCPGFAYIGSSNLSESAWGRLVKDRGTGLPKMTCRNWECGVLVRAGDPASQPPRPTAKSADDKLAGAKQGRSSKSSLSSDSGGLDDMGLFDGCVPVPMELPAAPLIGASGLLSAPWFFTED